MTGRDRFGRPEIVRPGLERIRAAFEMSGHPERSFLTFHIAGTNGKGSTAAFLEAIMRRLVSEPVGLYTSPHLVSPEERIRVAGAKIPIEDLRRALRRAARFSREMGPDNGNRLSYFEEMTWAACDWFRKKSARLVVMEAGLGGRWDATSACNPAVSIVTTVGKDHQEWLGDSLREIASEKAEIFRRGVPAILGRLRGITRSVATTRAKERGSPIWELGRDFSWEVSRGGRIRMNLPGVSVPATRLGMAGEFQRDNAAIACAAAWRWASEMGKAPGDFSRAASEGMAVARWPGRFTMLPGKRNAGAWADGAHNPEAARALGIELERLKKGKRTTRIVALWSMLRDKDISGFIRELSDVVDGWVIFPMEHERAATSESLSAACRRRGVAHRMSADFAAGWETARRWAGHPTNRTDRGAGPPTNRIDRGAGPGGIVIVCGSLAAVGEAYRHRVGEIT